MISIQPISPIRCLPPKTPDKPPRRFYVIGPHFHQYRVFFTYKAASEYCAHLFETTKEKDQQPAIYEVLDNGKYAKMHLKEDRHER